MSESFVRMLLEVSIIGSVVVLMGSLFQVLLRTRVSARWSYLLWIIVMVRFVVFVAPPSPTSIQNLLMRRGAEEPVLQPEAAIVEQSLVTSAQEDLIYFSPPARDPVTPVVWENDSVLNAWQIGLWVWAIGAAWLLFRLFLGMRRVNRLIRESSQASKELESRFSDVRQRFGRQWFGIGTAVSIRVSSALNVPALAGLVRPVVLVPDWFESKLDHQQQTMVFTHELIHMHRRDAWIQLATRLVVILHWFNPLVRWADKVLAGHREMSCDQLAIERLESFDSKRSSQELERCYGNTILNISIYSESDHKRNSQWNPVLMGGFIGNNETLIKQRIAMLVHKNSQTRFGFALAFAATLLLAAVGFTSAQTVSVDDGNPRTEIVNDTPDTTYGLKNSSDADVETFDQPLLLPMINEPSQKVLTISAGETIEVDCSFVVAEVLNEDPLVALVTAKLPQVLSITAKKVGETVIHVSDPDRRSRTRLVRVLPNVSVLKSKLFEKFPEANIALHADIAGIVYLEGFGDAKLAAEIEAFAKNHTDLQITNRINDKKTVAIETKVFEVSRTKLAAASKENTLVANPFPGFIDSIAQTIDGTEGDKMKVAQLPDLKVVDFVEALEERGIAKLKSSPTLVAVEGTTAKFFNGGEIPIRIQQDNGQDKIEFRTFGTEIEIVPVLGKQQLTTLQLKAQVSEIDPDAPNEPGIPHFRVRRISTGVMMELGQTLALISEYRTKGEADKEDTELVFFIKPRIVEMPNLRTATAKQRVKF